MKPILWSALATMAVAGVAGAATVECPAPPNPGVPVTVVDLTITCGGLTFSNFDVIPAAGYSNGQVPEVDLFSVDTEGGSVNLSLNPNMASPSASQSINFYYQVSGPATAVGLVVGGINAFVVEGVCSEPIPTAGPMQNVCPAGSSLASFVAFSSPPGPNVAGAGVSGSTFYVYKSINVSANQFVPGGGALSSFTESWTPAEGGEIPEPASLLLMGSGFIALGTMLRRAAKART